MTLTVRYSALKAYPPCSAKTFFMAGIKVTVYGLNELHADTRDVARLWLLHPRLLDTTCMEPIAWACIHEWDIRGTSAGHKETTRKGMIAASFSQRNHGDREVSETANMAWSDDNETHVRDMP
jgi:hypothetical protein